MKLFFLDDNIEFAELSAEVARREGWSVQIFHEGQSFLDAVNIAEGPALLLIDMNLPGLDGSDVITRLKDPDKRFRIRLITGDGTAVATTGQMTAEARELDIGTGLTKPLGVDAFRAVLAEEAERLRP